MVAGDICDDADGYKSKFPLVYFAKTSTIAWWRFVSMCQVSWRAVPLYDGQSFWPLLLNQS